MPRAFLKDVSVEQNKINNWQKNHTHGNKKIEVTHPQIQSKCLNFGSTESYMIIPLVLAEYFAKRLAFNTVDFSKMALYDTLLADMDIPSIIQYECV